MATPFRLKRSAVSGKRPTLSDLQLGELALNTYDAYLYGTRDAGGVGIGTTVTLLTPWTENFGAASIYYENVVGVGTTNPTSKFTVQGDVLITGFSTVRSNFTVAGVTTTQHLRVTGFTTTVNQSITGVATIGTLAVSGVTTSRHLNVAGVATFNQAKLGVVTSYDLIANGDYSNTINLGNDLFIYHISDPLYRANFIHSDEYNLVLGNKSETGGNTSFNVLVGIFTGNDAFSNNTSYVSLNYGNSDTKLNTIGAGVTVFGTAFTNQLNVSGVSTLGTGVTITSGGNINAVSGVITATQFVTGAGAGITITNNTIFAPTLLVLDPSPAGVGTTSGVVQIKGDLYVDGTQFVVNSSIIELGDFNIGIATTVGTNALLDGAGLGIGSVGIRKTITWENSSSSLKSSENWKLPDNKNLILGDGNDLQIYHDGTNSYIDDSGTGDLYIRSNAIRLQKYTGETTAEFIADNAAILYYDNVKEFETTGYGATVYGILDTQGLTASGIATISVNSSSNALRITQTGTGNALVVEDSANPDGTPFVINASGDVGIGTVSPSQSLDVRGNTSVSGVTTTQHLNVVGFTTVVNQSITGVATIGTLAVSGVTTTQHLNVVGFTTVVNQSITGVATVGSNLAVAGVTTTQHLNVTGFTTVVNQSITGVATIGTLAVSGVTTSQHLNITGFTTVVNQSITGVATVGSNLAVAGVTTTQHLNVVGFTTIVNEFVTGVSTIGTLAVSGVTTTQHLNVTGFTTVVNQSITGVATVGSNLAVAGVTTTQHLNVTGFTTVVNQSITGVATVGSNLAVAGVTTTQHLNVTGFTTVVNQSITGVATIGTLGVSGVTTTQHLNVTGFTTVVNQSITGVATVGSNLAVAGVTTTQHLNVTGFTTVVNQSITGVLTVTNGIQGIGIQSAGFNIAVGLITAINFVGAGNSFSYNSGTKTVDINIGGSQWTFVEPGSPTTSSIYRVNGNVGIGTTNPTSKLHLVGDALITGVSTFTGNVSFGSSAFFGDNDILYFGDGNDLAIYHNGSNSIVGDFGTGNLILAGNTSIDLMNPGGTEYYARFNNNGAAELYYDNVKEFETTGYGATVFGILQSQGLNVTGFTTVVNQSITGVATIGTLAVSGVTTTQHLNVTGFTTVVNQSVTGVATIGTLAVSGVTTTQHLNVTGFTTVVNESVTGVSTIGTLAVSGVTTTRHLNVIGFTTVVNQSITGVATVGSNLTVVGVTSTQHLNVSGIATINRVSITTEFNVYAPVATFHNDINIIGNVSIGGTTVVLNAAQLQIKDKDIVLGITTNALGNDVSTDTTANHGGIAIASTEGTPLINIDAVGIDSIPNTYKQIMWIKSNTWTGLSTDAWLFNYGVGIGSTQIPNGVRLAVGSVQFTQNDLAVVRSINASGFITATTFNGQVNAGVGTITTLSGTNINYSGIATVGTLGVSGVTTTQHLNVVGFTTVVNQSVTGVATIGTLAVSGVTTTQHLNVTGFTTVVNQSITGVATIGTLAVSGVTTTQHLNVTGFTTVVNQSITGVATVGSNLAVAGVTTTRHLNVIGFTTVVNESVTGVSTIGTLAVSGVTTTQHLNVTGFTTVVNQSITGVATVGSNLAVAGVTTTKHLGVVGVATISDNSSSDALRITQTGSGNALVVEDEANPDATPFVVRGDGAVGIGTTNPVAPLHIASAQPIIRLAETDAAANNRNWNVGVNNQEFYWQAINDAGSGGGSSFKMTRSAQEIQTFEGQNSGVTWFEIDNANQRVGVGTSIASAVLDVRGNPWFRPNETGAKATALRLGRFSDSASAAYDIITDDAVGDSIEIQSNRYTGAVRFSRSSPLGIQTTFTLDSHYQNGTSISIADTTGTSTKIKLDEAGNTFFNNTGAVLVGTVSSTGTVSQSLQVTGGAYVSGNLGVGITNPTTKLDVIGNIRAVNNTFKGVSASAASLSFSVGGNSSEQSSPVAQISGIDRYNSRNQYDGDLAFNVLSGNINVEVGRFTYGGSLGIGTTNPGEKLHIGQGRIRLDEGWQLTWLSTAGTQRTRIAGDSGSNFIIETGASNTEALRVDSSQRVGINTNSPARPLHVNGTVRIADSAALEWGGTSAYIAGTSASNALLFNTSSTERVRIDSNGNLGINTTNPTSRLTVSGGALITGVSTLTGSVSFGSSASFIDNQHLNLGTGNDLKLYHSGTASVINNITGELLIGGDVVRLQSDIFNTPETYLLASKNAQVELYYDNVKEFETTGYGATVFGVLQTQGLFSSGISTISVNSSSDAVRITQLGSGNALVVEDETNPDVTPFVINATGFVGIGTTNPSGKLVVNGTSSGSNWTNRSNLISDAFKYDNGGLTVAAITADGSTTNGGVFQLYDRATGDTQVHLDSAPNAVSWIIGRNVGIGITNPGTKLNVVDNSSSDAVRITQTGSGNALVVEDSTNPDVTPFVVNASGSVGVGTTNPTSLLHLGPSNGNTLSHLYLASINNAYGWRFDTQDFNAGSVPLRIFRRVNGTDTEAITVLNQSGNVGLGSTLPTAALTIATVGSATTGASQIYLNGATSNRIDFNTFGVAPPAFATRSAGTKIVLYPILGGATVDYAMGVESGHIWQSVASTSSAQGFKWYGGTTELAVLKGDGNLGIGTTNPLQKLHVLGNVLVAAGNSTDQHITQKPYELNNGTLSWEGSAGQLFSITNNLTTGSIFSVNDVSGIPSIDVDANGTVSIAPFGSTEYVGIGTTAPTSKLTVNGDTLITGILTATNGLQGEAFESYEVDLIGYTGYHLRTEEASITLDDTTTTDPHLYNVTVTLPIEDSGIIEDTTFVPLFDGEVVPIENPFRLMITVNGVLQSAFINNTDYVYQSNFLGSRNGYTIDSDNNIKFTESIPTGSDIVARVLPVSNTATKIKNYPFKPTDIVLGY